MNSSSSSKPYSCVICHKRKVRCDRREPCSNCGKASAECIYLPPPPPRRRKRGRDANESGSQENEQLIRRTSGDSLSHRHETQDSTPFETPVAVPVLQRSETGKLIRKEGNSVYIDNSLWTSISHELPSAADVLEDASGDDSDHVSLDDYESSLPLSSGARKNLTEMHPNSLQIFRLWQTFLENVNPLTKILHAPTVQQQILEAMGELSNLGRELEALMFSIYCVALISLQPGEVEKTLGESKKKLLSRFRRGAQAALNNATFLRTTNLMVLQAFILYLLSMRGFSDPHTIWTLSGAALRIAQRMGLHRDGSGYGLSIFETEMRRRIWFQLTVLDATSAQSCGVASGLSAQNADTQPPMNANDSDLDPRMMEPACEKQGPTEMIFCLARSEFGKWLRRWSKRSGSINSPWAFLSSPSMTLKEKDHAVDELEYALERSVLQYCDQSIPLHLATTMMARSTIHYSRLIAHHPRQYQDPDLCISQSEKDVIFENCFKMAEYADFAQMHPEIQRFSWHMSNHMPWDAIIFMLSEMRSRTDPEEKSRVWQLIGGIYSRHISQRSKYSQTPLHAAIQHLIVKAWRAYTEECNLHNRVPTSCPTVVATLLGDSSGSAEPPRTEESRQSGNGEFPSASFNVEIDNGDFFLGESPLDWNNWDNLLTQFQESLVDDMTFLP